MDQDIVHAPTPNTAFKLPAPVGSAQPKEPDPLRPETVNGRYPLHDPETGKPKTWQRVTNFVKLTDDNYYLELWKQRNVVVGVARMLASPAENGLRGTVAEALDRVSAMDVKADKDALNSLASRAQDVADAYRMSSEGTELHKSTEMTDFAGGDLNRAPERHRPKVRMYLDALAVNGLTVLPDHIERVVLSTKYSVAGKYDRVFGLRDGSFVIGDLKTGSSLDLSFPAIAAQLECYADGINSHGVYAGKGERYDRSLMVREDFGIVVHLPSDRDEVTVYMVDLSQGRTINAVNLAVRDARRIKHQHVSAVFQGADWMPTPAELDAHWLEQMNAAHTYDQLVSVAQRAKTFRQWNERLADQARIIATELRALASAS